MGSERPTWEEETLELIRDAEQERYKAEQRRAAAERAIDSANQKVDALRTALRTYRAKYGLPEVETPVLDERLGNALRGKSVKDVILYWANTHNGTFVGDEAARASVAAGYFRTVEQARGTLYKQVTRMPEFEQVGRGVWQRRTHTEPLKQAVGAAAPAPDELIRQRMSLVPPSERLGTPASPPLPEIVDPEDLPFD